MDGKVAAASFRDVWFITKRENHAEKIRVDVVLRTDPGE